MAKAAAKADAQLNRDTIRSATQEFTRLKQAQREYLSAYKSGDQDSMRYWENEILKAKESLDAITNNTQGLELNADTKKK